MARILLAEDDDSLRVFLKMNLGRAGHEVEDHADGDSAWEALERSGLGRHVAPERWDHLSGYATK